MTEPGSIVQTPQTESEEKFKQEELKQRTIEKMGPLDKKKAEKKTEEEIKSDWDAFKENFFLFANFTGYYTYSKLFKGAAINGGNMSGVLAPALKLNDKTFFILLNNASYRRAKQVYQEDQGPKMRTESAIYSFTPTLKYNLTDKLTVSPSYIYTKSLTRETAAEKWGWGLYDYRDKGGGLDLSYIVEKKETSLRTARAGFQYYNRTYPHFKSLASLSGIPGLEDYEEKEKDFGGTMFSLGYDLRKAEGLSYAATFSALLKDYISKKVENDFGGRDPKNQYDQVYTLGLNLDYNPPGPFQYKLNNMGMLNLSNQHLAEGSFPDIIFTRNFYGSYSITETPSVWYTQTLSNEKEIVYGVAYGFTFRKYQGREAKDVDGNKTGQLERDFNHNFTANAVYKHTKNWNLGCILDYQMARSNYKDEGVFRYNYEILNISIGFSYNY